MKRSELCLSQEKFVTKVGIDRTYTSKIEGVLVIQASKCSL